MNLEVLKYPVGHYVFDKETAMVNLPSWIENITKYPEVLLPTIALLDEQMLDTPYRPEGWTVRQVIHHLSDSHIQSLTRFKWTLAEQNTTIKAYDEAAFASLPDYQMSIDGAIDLLKGAHAKLGFLMSKMTQDDWSKSYYHPQQDRRITLLEACGLYDWHGRHHLGHILLVINSK